jgi:two-component system, chemotaxis family, CheB/CheR fusion protein
MEEETLDPTSKTRRRLESMVVGIGASAGGLSALKRFFEHIPLDSGLSFVVVVHLSPEHKSMLPDLLQPSAKFPVRQVTETMPLEPNNVYVIPPNANLSAIDTHLRLSKLEERRRDWLRWHPRPQGD